MFGPEDYVLRQDIATMIGRIAELLGVNVKQAPSSLLAQYPDRGEVSDYALDYMEWCAQEGILTGKQTGWSASLAPKNICKRAEMAKIITIAKRDVLG